MVVDVAVCDPAQQNEVPRVVRASLGATFDVVYVEAHPAFVRQLHPLARAVAVDDEPARRFPAVVTLSSLA